MTLTELRYIIAVAQEKHFGRAAEACFVSQPTLSVSIKKLEDELNTKIFRKDNLDIVYSITGKKHLNGILHYKLKSDNSEEIFLSEHAVNDRFVTEQKNCAESNNSVSRLFTKIIKNGYIIGKSNEK